MERSDPDYDELRKQFGYYLNTEAEAKQRLSPRLIVVPCDEADIQAIVRFASKHDHSVVVRSGGHSYQATSSTNAERSIQVDMRNFTGLSFEEAASENTKANHALGLTQDRYKVRVGSGIRLKELNICLHKYNCFIPAGMCMNVGVGGHFQSSAMGLFAKAFGRGFDYISHIKIVLASGELVIASENTHAELFWALRGGSPGAFGIVIEYQFDAINALNHTDISYGIRWTWDYSDERAREVLSHLFEISSCKDYTTTRNCVFTMMVSSDKREGYMLTTDDECQKQTIIVIMVWCGVDGGSIRNQIPDHLREDETPAGSTFYDYYVGGLKAIEGDIPSLSKEFCVEDDPNMTLSRIALSLSLGTDNTGNPQKIYSDYKLAMRLARQDKAWEESVAQAKADRFGIDLATEEIRYANASRHVNSMDFDHGEFVDVFVEQHGFLARNPHLGIMTQLSFTGILEEPRDDYPLIGMGLFRYDCWSVWRASVGETVAASAKAWSVALDTAFADCLRSRGAPGHLGTSHPAFPNAETDLSFKRVRESYYPDAEQYERLTMVRRHYDREEMFSTPFTVPPASDAAYEAFVRENGAFESDDASASSYRPGDTKWFQAYAGSNILTLVGQMEHNALAQPDATYLTWIDSNGKARDTSFRSFRDMVLSKASWLRHHTDVKKGDRVVLCFLPGLDYIVALMACMYLGVVPVPTYPVDFTKRDGPSAAFDHVLRMVQPKFVLADPAILPYRLKASKLGRFVSAAGKKTPWRVAGDDTRFVTPAELSLEDEAIIQYTSGTSSERPKGAILTHGNLLSQFQIIGDSYTNKKDVHGFAWVPPYHDLGLFMAVLTSVMFGFHFTAVSPVTFLKNPLLWFSYLSEHRITHTAGPNFAYALCFDRIQNLDPEELESWDLSELESLGSGGDPIDHELMEQLLSVLQEHCKLSADAFTPCYGLAEVGCSVTIDGKQTKHLKAQSLYQHRRIEYVPQPTATSLAVRGCGTVENESVAIVDANSSSIGADRLGEIWINSPSLARNYVEKDRSTDLNRQMSSQEESLWFASGDIGFIHDGELFVVGRMSDLVELGDRMIIPHHIEQTVNEMGNFRKGNTTSFSRRAPNGDDSLHIAVEIKGDGPNSRQTLASQIAGALRAQFDLGPEISVVVHYMPLRSAFRTTSGKLQRSRTRSAIFGGSIEADSHAAA